MIKKQFKSPYFFQLACISVGLLVAATSVAKDKLPEVDKDGLHLIKTPKVAIAYAKPGAKLDVYSKVMLVDCFVQFRKDWKRDYNLNELGLEGRVEDKDVTRIKADLAAEFKKIFTETLTKNGHQVVDTAGPDVLLLRPAIINLDVTAPDMMRAGMDNTWISSAGEMTLYMELYDSGSSELIGRVVDPQADQRAGAQMASKVTNKAAADRILRRWAQLLSDHLTAVKEAG